VTSRESNDGAWFRATLAFSRAPADAMVRASRSAQRQKIAHRRKEAQLAARNCPIGFVYQNWKLQGNAYNAEMSML